MIIAAAYLRVSTEDQDEYSLDSQLKLIREYAEKNDYIVPDEYVFIDDGISGRSAAKREQFQNMIAMAKEKEKPFDAILLWKFSRFARNQEESIVYKTMLRKLDISVVSISELLPEGPFSSLIERIIEWMDEFYSIRLSGEVKRGMLEKASRGEPVSIAPFGYDMVDNNLVPNADAIIVREIFSAYKDGVGMNTIARQLGDRGIRTIRGNRFENRNIEYILQNPVYIGKIRWSKDGRAASRRKYDDENIVLYDGHHEPLIDRELWDAVQKRLEADKKKYARYARKAPADYMLKGLVRCDDCGSTLCLQNNSACPYLQCHKYTRGQCNTSHSLSVAKANRAVIAALEEAVITKNFNLTPTAKKSEIKGKDIDKLIILEKRKLARVEEAYVNGIDSLPEYAEKKRKVQAEIAKLKLEAEKEAPQPALDPEKYAVKVAEVLEIVKSPAVTEMAKNEALRSIISFIVYKKPTNTLDFYFYI